MTRVVALCSLTPMTNNADTARWSKSSPSWGSALRIQRNAYAFLVTMALTNGEMVCPSCDDILNLDSAEVDRVIPEMDYCEGNVVYVCEGCNQGRAALQSIGQDWTHVAAYGEAVREASATVSVPTVKQSRAWWQARPVAARKRSRWA